MFPRKPKTTVANYLLKIPWESQNYFTVRYLVDLQNKKKRKEHLPSETENAEPYLFM